MERTIDDNLRAAIARYYEEHPTGGTLHIVLDDGNCEDDNVQWCIDNPIREQNDREALSIARRLLRIPEEGRRAMFERNWR